MAHVLLRVVRERDSIASDVASGLCCIDHPKIDLSWRVQSGW